MKDKRGSPLIEGCILQSELYRDGPKVTYEGNGLFRHPDTAGNLRGGTMTHTQESLLDSHWVVVEYPKDSELAVSHPKLFTECNCK